MGKILSSDIEKNFSNMTIEELLNLEEKIMKILKMKIKENNEDWRKDFLDISVWSHLNTGTETRVGKWKIETF